MGILEKIEPENKRKMKFLLLCSIWLAKADDVHPVFYAIRDQNFGKALEVIKGMENVNVIGPGGQTPLMMSVLGGHYKLVKELLEMKADTSIPEKDGYTPMHGAGFQGRAEIAQMLINHGLDKSDLTLMATHQCYVHVGGAKCVTLKPYEPSSKTASILVRHLAMVVPVWN